MATGYIALDDWLPFSKMFAYMDAADSYRADDLFRKYRIKVRFKREWEFPDGKYRVVFCSVPKNQIHLFEREMDEIPKKMMILGYGDYEDAWLKILEAVEHIWLS